VLGADVLKSNRYATNRGWMLTIYINIDLSQNRMMIDSHNINQVNKIYVLAIDVTSYLRRLKYLVSSHWQFGIKDEWQHLAY